MAVKQGISKPPNRYVIIQSVIGVNTIINWLPRMTQYNKSFLFVAPGHEQTQSDELKSKTSVFIGWNTV